MQDGLPGSHVTQRLIEIVLATMLLIVLLVVTISDSTCAKDGSLNTSE